MSTQSKWAKRKARRIYSKMDTLLADMMSLRELYEGTHPDLDAGIEAAAHGVLIAQQLWETWYLTTWGRIPDDWHMDD